MTEIQLREDLYAYRRWMREVVRAELNLRDEVEGPACEEPGQRVRCAPCRASSTGLRRSECRSAEERPSVVVALVATPLGVGLLLGQFEGEKPRFLNGKVRRRCSDSQMKSGNLRLLDESCCPTPGSEESWFEPRRGNCKAGRVLDDVRPFRLRHPRSPRLFLEIAP